MSREKVSIDGVEYIVVGTPERRGSKDALDIMANRRAGPPDDQPPYMFRRMVSGKYGYFDEHGFLMYIRRYPPITGREG